jgi:serine/threonine-protein kinase
VKACAKCQRLFPDDGRFCPVDGGKLAPSESVPVTPDPEEARVGGTMCRGRYEVRRRIADGGMGRVYHALDVTENRGVAVKVLHADVAVDDIALERFKREFELSAELPHEHIVDVLDFQATEDESFALVMEYLEGEELRSQLQRDGVVRPERIVRILSQLAKGLREPHALKLVHRDIKPDNIFLCGTESGPHVKLLDFGSVRDNSAGAKKLTLVGTTIGSPYYMAPEQAQGLDDLDQRADVWSLAAITYEALTGQVPFQGASGPEILLAILGKEPTPPSVLANADGFRGAPIPDALDDVIADGLSKNAAIRIGSVSDLADRVGSAYGLEGSHEQWASTPEDELRQRIEQALSAPRATASSSSMGLAPSTRGGHDTPTAGDGDTGLEENPFADDDFVMGVPEKGTSTGTIVLIAVVAVVLIGVGLFFALGG